MISLPALILDIHTVNPVVMLSRSTASKLKFNHTDIITVKNPNNDRLFTATPVISEGLIKDDVIGISTSDAAWINIKEKGIVNTYIRRNPIGLKHVKYKMEGGVWDKNQIHTITNDISRRNFTVMELASFALTSYFRKYDTQETANFAKSMAEHGSQFNFQEKTYDKHSIGGIPGNKVSLLIIPIVASAGLLIPKTCSRSITSPSGTADTMEVLADVTFNPEEVTELASKSRGMIVWNSPLKLVPMDNIVIEVKKFLDIDPQEQMMAAIIATKIAMGIDGLIIDLPTGIGAKVQGRKEGNGMAHKFIQLCHNVGINSEVMLTDGGSPLGSNIGPALEAQEALAILEGKVKNATLNKSIELAGVLLEMGGITKEGSGTEKALELINSGKALQKMKEIIEVQGGDRNASSDKIPFGSYEETVYSTKSGTVHSIKNFQTKEICMAAGNPTSKKAGMVLHTKIGKYLKEGEPLFTIYSDSEAKLSKALKISQNDLPVIVESMVLKRIKPKVDRKPDI